MMKHNKDGTKIYHICDICANEIKVDDTPWINIIPFNTTYFDEYYEKNMEYSSTGIRLCGQCIRDTKFIDQLEKSEFEFRKKTAKILQEWIATKK